MSSSKNWQQFFYLLLLTYKKIKEMYLQNHLNKSILTKLFPIWIESIHPNKAGSKNETECSESFFLLFRVVTSLFSWWVGRSIFKYVISLLSSFSGSFSQISWLGITFFELNLLVQKNIFSQYFINSFSINNFFPVNDTNFVFLRPCMVGLSSLLR